MIPDPSLKERIEPSGGAIGLRGFRRELDLPPSDAFAQVVGRDASQDLPDDPFLEGSVFTPVLQDVRQHHEDEGALLVPDEPIDPPSTTSEFTHRAVIEGRIERHLVDDAPSISTSCFGTLFEHSSAVVGAEAGEALAPVSVVGIDVDAVAPPGVDEFMIEVARLERAGRHADHSWPQEREAGKGESGGEEVLDHRESVVGIGSEQVGVPAEVGLGRIKVVPRLARIGLGDLHHDVDVSGVGFHRAGESTMSVAGDRHSVDRTRRPPRPAGRRRLRRRVGIPGGHQGPPGDRPQFDRHGPQLRSAAVVERLRMPGASVGEEDSVGGRVRPDGLVVDASGAFARGDVFEMRSVPVEHDFVAGLHAGDERSPTLVRILDLDRRSTHQHQLDVGLGMDPEGEVSRGRDGHGRDAFDPARLRVDADLEPLMLHFRGHQDEAGGEAGEIHSMVLRSHPGRMPSSVFTGPSPSIPSGPSGPQSLPMAR